MFFESRQEPLAHLLADGPALLFVCIGQRRIAVQVLIAQPFVDGLEKNRGVFEAHKSAIAFDEHASFVVSRLLSHGVNLVQVKNDF